MVQLDVSTVWHNELRGPKAYFPDPNNEHKVGMLRYQFAVEGAPVTSNMSVTSTPQCHSVKRNPLIKATICPDHKLKDCSGQSDQVWEN